MRGVITIAKFSGIPVQLHWTFSLVVLWVAYQGWMNGWAAEEILRAALPLAALFICVVLHEFGHALTARRYGVETRDIILSPIGGVARMTRLPDKPLQEWAVAAAGPIVNLVLAALFLGPVLGNPQTRQKLLNLFDYNSNYLFVNLSLWQYLALSMLLLNLLLALFNLLPAFPMDGGRMLRALLSVRLGRKKATRVATYLGQALAVLFVLYGLWSQQNLLMVFIGIFVFVMGSAEYNMVRIDHWLEHRRVADLMRQDFTRLYPDDSMELVAEISTRGKEKNFLILDQWQEVQGILSGKEIMAAVKAHAFGQPVADFYLPSRKGLLPQDTLKEAVTIFQQLEVSLLPVYNQQTLVGVLESSAIEEFLQAARKTGKAS